MSADLYMIFTPTCVVSAQKLQEKCLAMFKILAYIIPQIKQKVSKNGDICANQQTLNREALFKHVWNMGDRQNKRVVDTVVKQLRHKLVTTPYEIRSVYKLGYQLQKRESTMYNFPQSGETEPHP